MAKHDKFFSEVIRYSQTNQGQRLRQFLLALGPLGRMIADMIDVTRGRNAGRDVENAIEVLKNEGYDVTPALDGPIAPPPLRVPTVRKVPQVGRPGQRKDQWPEEHPIASPVRTLPSALDGGDMVWHQTPESSNVYSFAYDFSQQILYVQYKEGGPPNGKRRGVNSCTGDTYTYYSRPHVPGTVYAYGSRAKPIPEAVYYSMKSASSKGTFVWQNLRVCGSHAAHQVPYTVATVPMPRDGSRPYVPRKAIEQQSVTLTDDSGQSYQTQTLDRFRVRTVPIAGTGRRRAYESTIQRTI